METGKPRGTDQKREANLPLGCFQLHLRLYFPVFLLAPVSDYTAMSGGPSAAKRCTCCEIRVAGRRSLKSENNKIHLTPSCFMGPRFPRNERNSQKGDRAESNPIRSTAKVSRGPNYVSAKLAFKERWISLDRRSLYSFFCMNNRLTLLDIQIQTYILAIVYTKRYSLYITCVLIIYLHHYTYIFF